MPERVSTMHAATTLNVSATGTPAVDPNDVKATHDAAVNDIVGMVRAKYEDEGDRNFAIGARTYEHLLWQKEKFPAFEGQDFDNLCNRVRDDVRIFVAISPKAIKLGEWVRCHVLRELVRTAAGDAVANAISFFEYRSSYGEALHFVKAELHGELKPGWLDFYKGVAADRATGKRVSSEDFMARHANVVKALKDAAVAADPAAAAAKAASEALKAKARAVSKANEDVTSSVSDSLVNGYLTPEGVMSIVENVTRHHGLSLPTKFGFDPATCTVDDCRLLADTMFAAGKFVEIKALASVLSKMVATVEKAAESQSAKIDRKAARLKASA
jgi:hypothetical protein